MHLGLQTTAACRYDKLILLSTGYVEISLWDSLPDPATANLWFELSLPHSIVLLFLHACLSPVARPHYYPIVSCHWPLLEPLSC